MRAAASHRRVKSPVFPDCRILTHSPSTPYPGSESCVARNLLNRGTPSVEQCYGRTGNFIVPLRRDASGLIESFQLFNFDARETHVLPNAPQ